MYPNEQATFRCSMSNIISSIISLGKKDCDFLSLLNGLLLAACFRALTQRIPIEIKQANINHKKIHSSFFFFCFVKKSLCRIRLFQQFNIYQFPIYIAHFFETFRPKSLEKKITLEKMTLTKKNEQNTKKLEKIIIKTN